MRSIGKGAEAGRMFCGDSIQNAEKEAICENEGNKNIAVAVDGTWQKRGYTSLNGVVTVTSIDTGKSYYGSAIRKNHCSVQNMRQAIWAIFLHKLSTDEYPQHGFCPIGEDSWCGFKKAEASGKSYKHKNSLPVDVVEAMRPIDDQRTVTVRSVMKVHVELQHPSDLPKLEDGLKHLEKSDTKIQCITENPDEYIIHDTEELHLENCLKDVKEDKACIPLNKTCPVVVVSESVSTEVKRRVHEKRRPRIKENKDYYFIPKR
ncbi:elongation factor 2 [Trichonephila clavipes]|nr:elongation factor 2 [Trichonephila clavipes]